MKYRMTAVPAEQTESSKIQMIHDIVTRIRDSEKMGVKYMQWWEEKAYARDEGYEEGHEDGVHDKLLTLIQKKLAKGKNVEEIADALEETTETIEKLIAELKKS